MTGWPLVSWNCCSLGHAFPELYVRIHQVKSLRLRGRAEASENWRGDFSGQTDLSLRDVSLSAN